MSEKVLLIVNPVAGTRGGRTALFDILDQFCRAGYEVTVQLTQRQGHGRELAASAAAGGYDMVCCCGGDGTLNEVINGIVASGSRLPLGYIPMGSTNDFAETLGLMSIPSLAAHAITTGRYMDIDVGCFCGDRCFSYIASFGAFTAASYSAPQDLKNAVGHLAYVVQGILEFGNIAPYDVTFRANGEEKKGRYVFGSVSNTRSVGGIVKLPENSIDLSDGLFEIIMVKEPKGASDLNTIITGITSSDFSLDVFEYFKTDHIEFDIDGNAAWTLDGEKAEPEGTVVINNLGSAIRLRY